MREERFSFGPPPLGEPRKVRRGREALIAIYQGLTVAYCPRDACANVELIFDEPENRPPDWTPPQEIYHERDGITRPAMFHCSNCRYVGPLEWPDDYEKIARELERRPVPQTRNWYPAGHPFAVQHDIPDGQTVRDLKTEFAERGGN
jgi:hypothetical protein